MPTWIGFEKLTDLLDECPPFSNHLCYVSVPQQTTSTVEKYGIENKTGFLNVQFYDHQINAVKYYRVRLGTAQYIGGRVDEEAHKRQWARALSAFEAVTAYLTAQGYRWREGLITWNKDMVLFESAGDALHYDKENNTVVVVPEMFQEAA